jgi:hypothetical protein
MNIPQMYLPILLSVDFWVVSYFDIMKNVAMEIFLHVFKHTFISIYVLSIAMWPINTKYK